MYFKLMKQSACVGPSDSALSPPVEINGWKAPHVLPSFAKQHHARMFSEHSRSAAAARGARLSARREAR